MTIASERMACVILGAWFFASLLLTAAVAYVIDVIRERAKARDGRALRRDAAL